MEDEHEEESRFAHLLQPLRNLADNWSIDIASELEEYLHELESITFSFDGIGKSLNFAEAALLIQGSTIIYSKKVEHLYTLLYQTIDFLREQKKKVHKRDDAGGPHGEEDGGAADDDEDEFREQEAEFLTLDDMKESENIDLDESGDTNRLRINLTRGSTPLALMTLNAEDSTSDGTKKTDFRMNTCAVHSSGALLLEDERRLRDDTFKAPAPPDQAHRGMSLGGDRLLDGSNPVIGNADRSLDSSDDEDNEDIDPEGKGKEKEGEDKGKEKEDEAERKKAEEEEEEERNRQGLELPVRGEQDKAKAGETDKADGTLNKSDQEATLGNANRGRGKRTARTEGDEEEVDEDALRERLFNLWATMDPHSLQGMRAAPFKRGKTYRVPASLVEQDKSAKGKGKSKAGADVGSKEDSEANESLPKDETTMETTGASAGSNLFKVKGPYLPEFNYLYLKEMKRRVNERKKEKNLRTNKTKRKAPAATGVTMDEPAEFGVEFVEEPEVIDAIEALAVNVTEIEPSHVQAAMASTSGLPLPGLGGDEGDLSSDEDNMGWNAEPMAFDEDAVHRNAAGAQPDGAEVFNIEEGQIIQSYEDLCRKHIENYLSSANAFAIETSLTKRVADWRAKLEPILSRQEEAKPFDIHSYGESVVARFRVPDKEQPVSTFGDLVEEEEGTSEICRLFAATLQLANHGNVQIIPEHEYDADVEDEDERMHIQGSFSLKLMSSTLVTFETNNNINIAVLKKKLGEGDESEEHQDQLSQKDGKTAKKKSAQKRKRNEKNKKSDDEEEEEEDEMLLSEDEAEGTSATLKRKAKGKAKRRDSDEEDDEVEAEEEEEEEAELVGRKKKTTTKGGSARGSRKGRKGA